MKLPPVLPEPLHDEGKIVRWIAELTSEAEPRVRRRLREEFDHFGIHLRRDFRKASLTPHVWTGEAGRFHRDSRSFPYGLIIWNRNRIKLRMRRWMGEYLAKLDGRTLEVLMVGEGLGFDAVYLSEAGHRVTYFDLPGYAPAFARRLFDECALEVTLITDQAKIPEGAFDAVVCLDVIEHVPDPSAFVRALRTYLRPRGHLIVHAPFYCIGPGDPTHLDANRRYSGDLSLFEKHGLQLTDGTYGWAPLALRKLDGGSPARDLLPKLLLLRLIGLGLAVARFWLFPFCWVDFYRSRHNQWFDQEDNTPASQE